MKIYGVDLTTLPLESRRVLREALNDAAHLTTMIFGKSGGMNAVIVYWHRADPFPGGVPLPPGCPWVEIPDGAQDLYISRYRVL